MFEGEDGTQALMANSPLTYVPFFSLSDISFRQTTHARKNQISFCSTPPSQGVNTLRGDEPRDTPSLPLSVHLALLFGFVFFFLFLCIFACLCNSCALKLAPTNTLPAVRKALKVSLRGQWGCRCWLRRVYVTERRRPLFSYREPSRCPASKPRVTHSKTTEVTSVTHAEKQVTLLRALLLLGGERRHKP